MDTRPLDTSPEAWQVYRATLRKLGPAGRVRLAVEMSEAVRGIHVAGLLQRNPSWTERDAVRHIVRSQYGVELPADS